jgi:hypothetical protein
MSIEEKRRLLLAFDELIRSNRKGSAKQFAKSIGTSKSTFFRLLEYMREELKAPVVYSQEKGKYCYEQEGFLFFGFVPGSILKKEDLKKITGGEVGFALREEKYFAQSQLVGLTCGYV